MAGQPRNQMELDTGWFRDWPRPGTSPRQRPETASKPTRVASADEVLRRVSGTTGATLDALLTAQRGRAANPARRFAVWALRRYTNLTLTAIGARLLMTPKQVENVLSRMPGCRDPAIRRWIGDWLTSEERGRGRPRPGSKVRAG